VYIKTCQMIVALNVFSSR